MFKEGDDIYFLVLLDKIQDNLTYIQQEKSFIYYNSLDRNKIEILENLIYSC